MEKVLLVDYYGMCDRNGHAIGHSSKVLKEYRELLKDKYKVSAAVSPCLAKEAGEGFEKVISLKYDVCTDDAISLIGRIKDKFKLFYNIHEVLKLREFDILWFYKTDFFLFLYFWCRFARIRPKTVALVYQTEFSEGILARFLNLFYLHGMRKFDGVIYTQRKTQKIHSNMLFLPDYYYDEKKYDKYRTEKKEEKAVCMGTMTPFKKLEELIEAFNRNGMRLEIRGYFYEKDRFFKLMRLKKDNIFIEDVCLSEEDYYQTLAGAKYSILPYDIRQYHSRTSGILQESLFLDTIPVAPIELLQENEIKGIGYNRIEELADVSSFTKYSDWDYTADKSLYNKKELSSRLVAFLENISAK